MGREEATPIGGESSTSKQAVARLCALLAFLYHSLSILSCGPFLSYVLLKLLPSHALYCQVFLTLFSDFCLSPLTALEGSVLTLPGV